MRMDCESCGGCEHVSVYQADDTTDIVCCSICGLVWNRAMLASQAVDYYSSDYRAEFSPDFTEAEPFSRGFLVSMLTRASCVVDFLQDELQPGRRHLDIGCGEGTLLALTRERGLVASGMELDQRLVRFARDRYGLAVERGTLDSLPLPAKSFDLVSLVHVVEHLYHPIAVLQQAAALVADGGRLYVEAPNLFRPWQKPSRFFFREHSFYFSANSLRRIVTAAGFSPLRIAESPRDGSLQLLAKKAARPHINPQWRDSPADVRAAIARNRWGYYLQLRWLTNKLRRLAQKSQACKTYGHLLNGSSAQRPSQQRAA